MRPIILTLFLYLLSVTAFGQSISKAELKYQPRTLDEAVLQLGKIHDDSTKQKIAAMTERQFVGNSHFGMGMWIRNNWGLWKGVELSVYFNSIGIFHPDYMSGIILTSYYRHLKGQDWELEKQVKDLQEFQKAATEHYNRLKTDTAYQRQIREKDDSFKVALFNEKKKNWSPGKKVSGYTNKDCRLWTGHSRTKVEGTIIEWNNDKLIIKVTRYHNKRLKKRLIKRGGVLNDLLIVPCHELFSLEQ